ncbi:MAG: hypothetical protein EA384_10480 [Spirochaetaceae bacterium]|nr:MAG: hypothetical protein EA384_10480 [Spirochaetaceae bacterium]
MVVSYRMRNNRLLLLCVTLLLCAVVLPARGQRQPAPVRPGEMPAAEGFAVPLLFVFSYSGDLLDPAALDVMRRSAAAALAARVPSVRLLIDNAVADQSRGRALARDAVGWIELSLTEEQSQTRIRAAAYAVTATAPVFEISYREPPGLAGPGLRRAWEPAAAEFERTYGELIMVALGDVRFTTVTLQAVPGTRISGLDDADHTVPQSGLLQLRLPAPLVYSLEARAEGHYPLQRTILVGEDELQVVLDQRTRSAYSWDLGLANAAYPSLEVARRLSGDYAFVRAGLTTYLIGIVPLLDTDDRSPEDENRLFIREDATQFNLQFGTYLHSAYGPLRGYLAAGGLWRMIHTRGFWGGDPVASWGVLSTLGVESHPAERWRLFFEWQPALYRTDYPEILMQRLPGPVHVRGERHRAEGDAFVTVDTAGSWVASLGSFRLGVRWQP